MWTLLLFVNVLSFSIGLGLSNDHRCPSNATVDLTGELPNDFDLLKKFDDEFPANKTWSSGDKILGCLCDIKPCLTLCCPMGEASFHGVCVKDEIAKDVSSRIIIPIHNKTDTQVFFKNNAYFLYDKPCDYGWMASWILQEDFVVLTDGSIHYPTGVYARTKWDFQHYCIFRQPNSTVYMAKICHVLPRPSYLHVFCTVVAGLIMIIIFTGYTVVPKLKNFHGLIFRCYIGSYFFLYVSILGALLTTTSRPLTPYFSSFMFGAVYFSFTCALWLNVMSYNIWQTFRGIRSIKSGQRKSKKKRFVWYTMYAWVSPAVVTISWVVMTESVPFFSDDTVDPNLRWYGDILLLLSVLISNTIMYTVTTLKIKNQKKETAHLTRGVNKHHETDEQWFNLHVKLFIIMGGHLIIWISWLFTRAYYDISTDIFMVSEMIQSFLILFIFLWKDSVKRSFLRKFSAGNSHVGNNKFIAQCSTTSVELSSTEPPNYIIQVPDVDA